MLILSISNYLKCAFTDPGFLPRATPMDTINTEKINNITVDLSGAYYPAPQNKILEIKGCEYDTRFCVCVLFKIFQNFVNIIKLFPYFF